MSIYSVELCVVVECFLQFVESDAGVKKDKKRGEGGKALGMERVPLVTRLQDRELQEMRDEGKSCDIC